MDGKQEIDYTCNGQKRNGFMLAVITNHSTQLTNNAERCYHMLELTCHATASFTISFPEIPSIILDILWNFCPSW